MQRRRIRALATAAGAGYLLGTIPSADLAAKIAGRGDIRAMGSGNPGAANAIKQLGAKLGYGVLVADIAKGAVASVVGRQAAGDLGSQIGGTAAVVGHCYPVWNGFKGGKGVAASVGSCLVNFPAYFVPDLAVAALTSALPWWKQRAYTATVASAALWTVAGVVAWQRDWDNGWGPKPTVALPISAAITSAVIIERFAAAERAAAAEPAAA